MWSNRVRTPGRSCTGEARVELEFTAQGDVDRAETGADRGGDRALDGDLVALDGLEGLGRQRGAGGLHDVDACLLHVPVEGRTGGRGGRLQDAAGGLGQLGPGAVTGDEGHAMGRHAGSPVNRHPPRHPPLPPPPPPPPLPSPPPPLLSPSPSPPPPPPLPLLPPPPPPPPPHSSPSTPSPQPPPRGKSWSHPNRTTPPLPLPPPTPPPPPNHPPFHPPPPSRVSQVTTGTAVSALPPSPPLLTLTPLFHSSPPFSPFPLPPPSPPSP